MQPARLGEGGVGHALACGRGEGAHQLGVELLALLLPVAGLGVDDPALRVDDHEGGCRANPVPPREPQLRVAQHEIRDRAGGAEEAADPGFRGRVEEHGHEAHPSPLPLPREVEHLQLAGAGQAAGCEEDDQRRVLAGDVEEGDQALAADQREAEVPRPAASPRFGRAMVQSVRATAASRSAPPSGVEVSRTRPASSTSSRTGRREAPQRLAQAAPAVEVEPVDAPGRGSLMRSMSSAASGPLPTATRRNTWRIALEVGGRPAPGQSGSAAPSVSRTSAALPAMARRGTSLRVPTARTTTSGSCCRARPAGRGAWRNWHRNSARAVREGRD